MAWTKAHTKLRNILAYLYDNQTSARRVAIDAGIQIAHITWGRSAMDMWQAIIEEVEKQRKLDALFNVAIVDYGDNLDLQAAITALGASSSAGSEAKNTDPRDEQGKTTIIYGDQIIVGDIKDVSGLAIGRGASASVNTRPSSSVQQPRQENTTSGANPLAVLAKRLAEKFSLSEIKSLCFDIAVEYEDLSGETKSAKIRELVLHLQRRQALEKLLAYVERERPNVEFNWRESLS